MKREVLLSAGVVLAFLFGLEVGSRIWVALRWPPGQVEVFTNTSTRRGSYVADRVLTYSLAPNYSFADHSHNSLGFRGRELLSERTPGVARIAIMGASTVYGPGVADHETAAARLEEALNARGIRAEVVNAGVPGWTSRETRLSFERRVLPLSPDVVVIVDGRNDVYPQLFRNYQDDYSHYRDLAYDFERSNSGWKRLFRVSYLLMGLMHRSQIFGFDPTKEHPHYGSIRFENRPTVAEAEAWVGAPERTRGFLDNLRSVVAAARDAGVTPVLATIPYRGGQDYASGNLNKEAGFEPVVTRGVRHNQELTRRLAAELSTPLVDAPELWTAEYLRDDCHFNAKGGVAFGARMLETVGPLLPAQ